MLRGLNSETVDLIYLDPSFNSNREYAAPSGIKAVNANGESTRSNITRADAPATPKPTPEPSGGSNTISAAITVGNVNEAPAFPSTETGTRTIPENAEAGQNIGAPVTATNPDRSDSLTYTLSGTDAASFDIDRATGQLKTKAVPWTTRPRSATPSPSRPQMGTTPVTASTSPSPSPPWMRAVRVTPWRTGTTPTRRA